MCVRVCACVCGWVGLKTKGAKCLVLSRSALTGTLGEVEGVMEQVHAARLLAAVPQLAKLAKPMLRFLAERLTPARHPVGATLCRRGDRCCQLLLVATGRIEAVRPGLLGLGTRTSVHGAGFVCGQGMLDTGRGGLSAAGTGEPAATRAREPHTVVALEETSTWVLSAAVFRQLRAEISRFTQGQSGKRKQRGEAPTSLSALEIGGTLGTGSFGTVRLVRWMPTGGAGGAGATRRYALKQLSKRQLLRKGCAEMCLAECNAMRFANHSMLLTLEATYQDERFIYLLLELVPGGELLRRLCEVEDGVLPAAEARFHCACLTDAFLHMHERSILYRDLKVRSKAERGGGKL